MPNVSKGLAGLAALGLVWAAGCSNSTTVQVTSQPATKGKDAEPSRRTEPSPAEKGDREKIEEASKVLALRLASMGGADLVYDDLASSHLRKRLSKDEFKKAQPPKEQSLAPQPPKDADLTKHLLWDAITVKVLETDPDKLKAADSGFPGDVPADVRRAKVEVSAKSGKLSYNCTYFLVEEDGKLKLADFKYPQK